MVRARQDGLRDGQGKTRHETYDHILPLLLHGDAAFAGQGVVMETLQLAGLPGYRTGGTIHLVINNQIGFTTSPGLSRSSIYSTDAAHITQTPIFHINGDDPEAAYRVIQIALDYRREFDKDVVLDLVGFRRLGHNEGDEPSYTQPVMYARVKAHPGTRHLYAKQLIREGVITRRRSDRNDRQGRRKIRRHSRPCKRYRGEEACQGVLAAPIDDEDGSTVLETGVAADMLKQSRKRSRLSPRDFHINPKMVGQLARRAKMGEGEVPMDWAFGEAMAIGSLVLEGSPGSV